MTIDHEPQSKRVRVEVDAEAMVASLEIGRQVSVFYADDGWVTGVVASITDKTILLEFVRCSKSFCQANSGW